jgi:hypothetical protein
MVAVAYAGLPEIGEILYEVGQRRRGKYGQAKVLSLYCNFVVLDTLSTTDNTSTAAIHVKNGTMFSVFLPPLDDRVTKVRVVAVGEIRGKQETSTKYRAAVVQRKFETDAAWGPLETLDAGGLPDAAHCQVHTHKRSRMRNSAPHSARLCALLCVHAGRHVIETLVCPCRWTKPRRFPLQS